MTEISGIMCQIVGSLTLGKELFTLSKIYLLMNITNHLGIFVIFSSNEDFLSRIIDELVSRYSKGQKSLSKRSNRTDPSKIVCEKSA